MIAAEALPAREMAANAVDLPPHTVYIYSMRTIPIIAVRPETAGRPLAPIKGRGTTSQMPHRFSARVSQAVDDGWPDNDGARDAASTSTKTQVYEENVRTILAGNDSPDIGFDLSINPYRGCEHGCIYCYARPTHSYLNLSPGLDFETKIIAKLNAAHRLREAFMAPGYQPQMLNIGSATDAYQPAERKLGITRQVLEVMCEFSHAYSIITKSSGIERDIDLISPMAGRQLAAVYVSITTLDPTLARIMEPRASAPERRLDTIRRLAQAGIPVGVSVSPLIPFINEPELERILEAARDAGARSAFSIILRLPWEVNPLFQEWLAQHYPQRAQRVMARVREMRGGRDNDSNFGARMTGQGVWASLVRQRFIKSCQRLGLNRTRQAPDLSQFKRPLQQANPDQFSLF